MSYSIIMGIVRLLIRAVTFWNNVTVHSVLSNVAQILYPELTFLSLYRIIKYYSFKNIFKKGVIIHAG